MRRQSSPFTLVHDALASPTGGNHKATVPATPASTTAPHSLKESPVPTSIVCAAGQCKYRPTGTSAVTPARPSPRALVSHGPEVPARQRADDNRGGVWTLRSR